MHDHAAPGRVFRRAAVAALALGVLAGPALASIPYPPNDPQFRRQWSLATIKAPQAWTQSTGAGVVVAVVDTGVQFGIEDLPASKSAGSYNCVGTGKVCQPFTGGDDNGHGTHVASIIGAVTNNGVGMAGVAPDAQILSIKSISAGGTGQVSDIADGIYFAADQGAKVINLSVGPDSFGQSFPQLDCPSPPCLSPPVNDSNALHQALQPAFDYAAAHGALVVAAAGNTLPSAGPGPSLYLGMNNVLIVGATGPQDEAAPYSDTGSGPTFIWAPGGAGCSRQSNCIVIADPNGGYFVSEGTSFATPHVAGVAALMMAQGSNPSAVKSRIVSTGDQIRAGVRLDAAAAVGASSALPAPTAQATIVPVVAPSPKATTPAPPAPPTPPAPVATLAPAPVAPVAAPSPTHTRSTPRPRPSPKPVPTPTPAASEPVPQEAVAEAVAPAVAPSPDIVHAVEALAKPQPRRVQALSTKPVGSTQYAHLTIASVLFVLAAGGAVMVWLGRRVRA
ncbi:MAG: hypothetical protein NVSMB32_11840 [Actinomycetota bacterium]